MAHNAKNFRYFGIHFERLLCTIEMDFMPAIFTFLIMISMFMPEKNGKEK